MEYEEKKQQLIQQVLNEVRQEISKKPRTTRPKSNNNLKASKIQHVLERWNSRSSLHVKNTENKLIDLSRETSVIISGQVKSSDHKLLGTFDNVYSIPGDYLYTKPQGKGVNVVSVFDSKYCQGTTGDLVVYFDVLTNKQKLITKTWNHGDIRSFKSIDVSYYQQWFDPSTGRIPGTAVVAALWAKKLHPGKQVYLYGFELGDLRAWDQIIVQEQGITICT